MTRPSLLPRMSERSCRLWRATVFFYISASETKNKITSLFSSARSTFVVDQSDNFGSYCALLLSDASSLLKGAGVSCFVRPIYVCVKENRSYQLIVYIQKEGNHVKLPRKKAFRLLEILSEMQTQTLWNNQRLPRPSLHKMRALP